MPRVWGRAVTTYDNAPPPPEWTACVGNLCAACLATGNLCHVLTKVDDKPCCRGCTHRTEIEPLTWTGDQA